ncbi:MAG: sigma-70 family RNA polymerase sigma factor [Cellvibrionaceae bacterium]
MDKKTPVTQLLASWRSGDEAALNQLTPIVYESLRRLSKNHINKENNPTIQATELVHEAYLDLVNIEIDWQDRVHFFAVASRLMRRMLIDRARARLRKKRGGDVKVTSADVDSVVGSQRSNNVKGSFEQQILLNNFSGDSHDQDVNEQRLLDLDDALNELANADKRKAEALELNFFGGLTYPEIATALKISEATVDRDLRFAKAWVYNYMSTPA